MLFNSLGFILLFLPLTVIIYFRLNRWRLPLAAKAWLVLASLFFYGFWKAEYVFLILASMVINFALGTGLHRTRGRHAVNRKLVATLGVIFNLTLLGYFKYADFFIDTVNQLSDFNITSLELVLPLAISFFTFQQIAYLIDCYQQDTKEYDFLNYALFVTFFPQLIAGPIVHHGEMMPQFERLRGSVINWRNIALGLFIFAIGLFKKVVIADSFSVWVAKGFDTNTTLSFLEAWGATLSYTFQIFFDFSAYSEMAIGAALMFNIRLPVNFNSPYKSISIQEFWRRWHMTLSRWLREYIYFPLGGSYKGASRTYMNVIITFLLGGLWHGAAWTFVVWGLLHGAALSVQRGWQGLGGRLPGWIAWFITFLFLNITWVFFRSTNFDQAYSILKGLFGFNGFKVGHHTAQLLELPTSVAGHIIYPIDLLYWNSAALLLVLVAPNTLQLTGYMEAGSRIRFKLDWKYLLFIGVLGGYALSQMMMMKNSEFLYFNF